MRKTKKIRLFSRSSTKTHKKVRFVYKHWLVICGVCVSITVIALLLLILQQNKSGGVIVDDELRREIAPTPTPLPTITPEPSHDAVIIVEPTPDIIEIVEPTPVPLDDGVRIPDREIDFDELHERNSDIIAWLYVPGTNIDYPVVACSDNAFYVWRDLDGNSSRAGTIFMDMANNLDISDRVTVFYGHNMRNGTMFAELHRYKNPEFFDENREIKLYTTEGMREYDIIAAYVTDDRNILYQTNYVDDAVWEEYIEHVFNNTDSNANLLIKEIGINDSIITLLTCVPNQDSQRYVVQGLLRRNPP